MSGQKDIEHIFREYDIRGKYGEEIDKDVSWAVGKAISHLFSPSLVVVARDMREGSKELVEGFIEALSEEGVGVKYIGMVPTPILYFASLKGDIGVMITASHNPPEYNGIKIISKHKEIVGEDIRRIGKEAIKVLSENKEGKRKGIERVMVEKIHDDKYIDREIMNEYLEFLKKASYWNGEDVGVVMDLGNGVVGNIIDDLIKSLKINAEVLFKEPDGRFPNHLADPIKEETLKKLKEVCKNKGIVGVAFDGDGDRIGMVDEYGEKVDNDRLLVLLAQQEKERGREGKVVVELKISKAVEERLRELGFEPVFSKTGHTNIKEKMKESNAIFGMEISGHSYFNIDGAVYEDATIALLRVLSYLKTKGRTLKELLSSIPKYAITPEIRIEVKNDKFKEEVMKDIIRNAERFFKDAKNIIKIDGVKVEYERGWVMIRQSNTQPVINIRAEGIEERDLKKIMDKTKEVLEKYGINLYE